MPEPDLVQMEVAAFWIAPRSCVTLTREAISSFCGCHGKQCDTENKIPHSAGSLHGTGSMLLEKSHDDGQKLSKPTVFGAPSSPLSFDSESTIRVGRIAHISSNS
jgi:hypothetical protein